MQWWHLTAIGFCVFWWCCITKVWSVHHIIIVIFINGVCYRGFQKCAKFGCSGRSFNTKVYSLNYESSRQIGPIMSEVFFGKNYCGAHIAHIAHLRNFCILCIRPKSCFGGLNERWAATLFVIHSKIPVRWRGGQCLMHHSTDYCMRILRSSLYSGKTVKY